MASRQPLTQRYSAAANPGLNRQPVFSRGLNFRNIDCAASSGDNETAAGFEDGTRLTGPGSFSGPEELECRALVLRPRSGCGIEGANLPYQRCGIALPHDPRDLPAQLGCIRRLRVILGLWSR